MQKRLPQTAFPADLIGRCLMELGRSGGVYCFEAVERGAAHADYVGLTDDEVKLAQKRTAISGTSIRCRHITKDPSWTTETYDEVLCMDALSSVRHPFQLLDQLVDVTRGMLTVEVCDLGEAEQKKIG